MSFANVIIRTNPTSKYDGGDHMHVFNRRAILAKHAEHICFRRNADRRLRDLTQDGLLPTDGVAMGMLETISQYRFNRVSTYEFTITRISDGVVSDVFGGDGFPFDNPFTLREEVMNLRIFLDSRMKALRQPNAQGLAVFGVKGLEFWYGGMVDQSSSSVASVWDDIESKTSIRRTDPARRRMPGIENLSLSNNTVIEIDNIPDRAVRKLQEPLYDPSTVGPGGSLIQDDDGNDIEPILINDRRHRTRFEDALGMTAAEILRAKDSQDYYDHRMIRNHNHTTLRGAMRRKRMNDSEIDVPGDILDA